METQMQNLQPLVSIIMPTYNRAYCIKRAIESVLQQTYQRWELLIIDNQSIDLTETVVKSYNDHRIIFLNIDNEGVIARSRNKGIENAIGKYIAFLDSDDWWTVDKLKFSVDILEQGVDIVYHDLYIISRKNSKPKLWRKVKTRDVGANAFEYLISESNALSTSSVVVSTALMLQINGFSEDPLLAGAEDYDAWIRLSRLTNKFKRLKNTMGFYWQGDDNFTSAQRTINLMLHLSNIYGKEFKDENHKYLLNSASFQYMLGKAKYQLNDLNHAKEHFSKIIKSGKINATFIKACIWRVKLFFKNVAVFK
jgi:glycosyltransferase involved in cell wall biosynthesis